MFIDFRDIESGSTWRHCPERIHFTFFHVVEIQGSDAGRSLVSHSSGYFFNFDSVLFLPIPSLFAHCSQSCSFRHSIPSCSFLIPAKDPYSLSCRPVSVQCSSSWLSCDNSRERVQGLGPERNRTERGPRACRLRSLKSSQTHFASESGQIKSIRVEMDPEKGSESSRMARTDIEDKGP